MAKNYYLDKGSTGWWVWQCKDGSDFGSSPDKSSARSDARKACGGLFIIVPPNVDVLARRGYLSRFTVENLDGKRVKFSTGEISEAEFSFFFGLPCSNFDEVDPARKAITILKIWGIYKGGVSIDNIKELHNLTDDDFERLINRKLFKLHITVHDSGKIDWDFPSNKEKTK